jgi:hypothetical protein
MDAEEVMASAIGNAARGCGSKKDGFYLGGSGMSPDGTLLPLVWTLGSMVLETEPNLLWTVPERSLIYIDGEQSLDVQGFEWIEHRTGMLNRSNGSYAGSGKPQLQRLMHTSTDPLCLLKHMGRSFYTPATKALELVQQGPSERMDEHTVTSLAPYLRQAPLKLFYTSSQVGHFVTEKDRHDFLDYVFNEQPDERSLYLQVAWSFDYDEGKTQFDPTWSRTDWRWRVTNPGVFPNNGSEHWWVKLLSYQHRHKDLTIPGLVEREAVCFGTQITEAQRVVSYETAQTETGKDTIVPKELDDAQFASEKAIKSGVKVCILPPKGEESWQ